MPGPGRGSRKRRLDSAVHSIQARWGPDAIRRGQPRAAAFPHLATGFPDLDAVLEGGIPRGRLTVLSGTPTSGKRTLAALIVAHAQAATRRPAAYVDLCHTCDADYLQRCGVDLSQLLVARPADARQALDVILTLAEHVAVSVIVCDHWGALGPDPAARRYAAAALDRLAALLDRSGAALLMLDEPATLWRGFVSALLGDAADSALGHHAALRLALSRERWLSLGPDVRGYSVQVTVEKNKLGPAGRHVTLDIRFNGTVRGEGI